MTRKEYNGWFNYETWLAQLWMDEAGIDLAEEAQGTELDDGTMADSIKAFFYELFLESVPECGFVSDLVNSAMSEINWQEIAAHVEVDE